MVAMIPAQANKIDDKKDDGETNTPPATESTPQRADGCESGTISGPLVDFQNDTDNSNPLDWSFQRKWILIALFSLSELAANLGTIICAPVAPAILFEFHKVDTIYVTLLVSIWELGEVVGPLFIAPLSELYGRFWLYQIGNSLFILFSIGCALSSNIQMLVAFRFLSGLSTVSITLNPSIVGDLFEVESRGSAMALVGFMPMLGPVIGPIIGGHVGSDLGWRWCFWIMAGFMGALQLLFLGFMRETYKVQILKRKAKQIRKRTQDSNIRSIYDTELSRKPSQIFEDACFRPLVLLFTSPILFLFSLYIGVVYGYFYLIMTTITEVFESHYGFPADNVGLVFLGLGVGCLIGVVFCQVTLDFWVKQHVKDGKRITPEQRLPPVIFGGLIIPIGIFIYGWTAEYRVQWMAPIIGTAVLSLGLLTTIIPVQTYLVDTFGIYSASAIAGSIVFRNLGGAFFPLAGPPLNSSLGVGWGSSVLGFIALSFIPVPLLLMWFGPALRAMDKRKFDYR